MKGKRSGQSDDPQVARVLHELADAISKVMGHASEVPTAVPGLTLYQNTVPTAPNPCTYVPSLLVIPQGKKRVDLGKQSSTAAIRVRCLGDTSKTRETLPCKSTPEIMVQ